MGDNSCHISFWLPSEKGYSLKGKNLLSFARRMWRLIRVYCLPLAQQFYTDSQVVKWAC